MRNGPVLPVLLALSIALNLYLLATRGAPPPEAPPPIPDAAPAGTTADAAPAAATAADAAPPPASAKDGWRSFRAPVEHSIARTFAPLGDDGPALAAVYARLFVWDLDMQRDVLKGDEVEVVWRPTDDANYDIAVARYRSGKLGRTLEAFKYHRPGDDWPSWWRADGTEVPHRLKDSPLEKYEQITSLLKDRPTHAGMDFKTPVGTPVHAPRDGRVTQTNWNRTYNGNSIELKLEDGVVAKFLHLDETKVKPGERVKKGQVIGATGNTGRSTAPHLHYQLERGSTIVDPLDYHGTTRRRLPEDAMPAFRAEVERLETLADE